MALSTSFSPLFLRIASATALACVVAVPTAQAQQEVTINHRDRQAVNKPKYVPFLNNRFRVDDNAYQVRGGTNFEAQQEMATRPYFIFPLSGLSRNRQVTELSLRIFHPGNSLGSWRSYEVVGIYSVDRFSPAQLQALRTPANPTQADFDELGRIFDDLGDGTLYGSFAATTENNGKFQTVALNRDGVDALNRAIARGDQEFAIGMDLLSLNYTRSFPELIRKVQRVFGGSSDSKEGQTSIPKPPTSLLLTYGTTPPPASAAPVLGGLLGSLSLGSGLGLLALRRRRRRA